MAVAHSVNTGIKETRFPIFNSLSGLSRVENLPHCKINGCLIFEHRKCSEHMVLNFVICKVTNYAPLINVPRNASFDLCLTNLYRFINFACNAHFTFMGLKTLIFKKRVFFFLPFKCGKFRESNLVWNSAKSLIKGVFFAEKLKRVWGYFWSLCSCMFTPIIMLARLLQMHSTMHASSSLWQRLDTSLVDSTQFSNSFS